MKLAGFFNRNRLKTLLLAAAFLLGTAVLIGQIPQKQTPQKRMTQKMPASKVSAKIRPTILKVDIRNFDYPVWAEAWEINQPQALSFQWSTSLAATASARWIATDLPREVEGAKTLATGTAPNTPGPNKAAQFNINFGPFIAKAPPKEPFVYTYYIYVIPKDAQKKDLDPSNPVLITFAEPPPITQFDEDMGTKPYEGAAAFLKLAYEALKNKFHLGTPIGEIQSSPKLHAFQRFSGAQASIEVYGINPPIIYVGVARRLPTAAYRSVYGWYRYTITGGPKGRITAAADWGSDIPDVAAPVLRNPAAWADYGSYNGIPGDDPPHWTPILVKTDSLKIGTLHLNFQYPEAYQKARGWIENLGNEMATIDLTDRAMEAWQPVKLCGFIEEAKYTSGDLGMDHTEDYHDGEDAPTGPLIPPEQTSRYWPGLDWDMTIVPDPSYNYLASLVRPTVRVETEHFALGPESYWPRTNQWLQAVGRWVTDNGHDKYTEIHPAEMLVSTSENYYDKYETMAKVTVTGAWQGDPLNFVVNPPPRPSVDSKLHYQIQNMNGTEGYDRRENCDLIITPRGTPGNPNHLYCRIVQTGPGKVLKYNTGTVGQEPHRGLHCVIKCGWGVPTATIGVAAGASKAVGYQPTMPVKGAYLFYRSADVPTAPWKAVKLRDDWKDISVTLPVGATFWLRPAGSGWNFGQIELDAPPCPYKMTINKEDNKRVDFEAIPDREKISLKDIRQFSMYGRAIGQVPGQFLNQAAAKLEPAEAAAETLRSSLISLDESDGPFGVKNNGLGYKERAHIYFQLKGLDGEDGKPILDSNAAVIVDYSKKPPTITLRGTPGEAVIGAKLRAKLLLGNETVGYRVAQQTDVQTGYRGMAYFSVMAGTHVEDVTVAIEVLENPYNPWFKPKIQSSTRLFYPGIENLDGSTKQEPYQFIPNSLSISGLTAITGKAASLGEGKHFLEEMEEKAEVAKKLRELTGPQKLNVRQASFKARMKKR